MSQSNKLCLHDFHAQQSAKFIKFAGWEMPLSYGSAVEEHIQARSKACIFDVSHMGEILVSGLNAVKFLDYILTNKVNNIEIGQCVYSPFCYANGGTVDDLIAYRKSENEFLLCVNASNIKKDYDHLKLYSERFGCVIENLSNYFGQLAIQGPLSEEILSSVIDRDLSALKRMFFVEDDFNIGHALISRTGYTGENGYEIYCPMEDLEDWALSFEGSRSNDLIKWAGLAARDSLRLEAGYSLYGHELSSEISPIQAGLNWTVNWEKNNFIGRECLLSEYETGRPGKVNFYEVMDRRIPREGCEVFYKNKKVGKVLSGGFSPNLGKPIGSAWISSEAVNQLHLPDWNAKVRNSYVEIEFGKPVLAR